MANACIVFLIPGSVWSILDWIIIPVSMDGPRVKLKFFWNAPGKICRGILDMPSWLRWEAIRAPHAPRCLQTWLQGLTVRESALSIAYSLSNTPHCKRSASLTPFLTYTSVSSSLSNAGFNENLGLLEEAVTQEIFQQLSNIESLTLILLKRPWITLLL